MSDRNSDYASLSETIRQGVDNRLKDLHTSMPGIIESFDASAQTVSVKPAIRRVFKFNDGEKDILAPSDLPILINVPINYPRGGGYSLTFPISKGDECLLVFCERSIDKWHSDGGVQNPLARRFHSLSDAVALVGVSSIPNKVPSYNSSSTQLKADNGSVVITLSNNKLEIDANTNVDINTPTINLNGDVNVSGLCSMNNSAKITGSLTNNNVNVGSTHTHPQGPDSDGNTEQDTGNPQ